MGRRRACLGYDLAPDFQPLEGAYVMMQSIDIEVISELSPMQQAMLFHSLYAPGSGVYVLQMSLRLAGRLDIPAFERAWRTVVARHAILRSAFFWEGLEKPAQVVFRAV